MWHEGLFQSRSDKSRPYTMRGVVDRAYDVRHSRRVYAYDARGRLEHDSMDQVLARKDSVHAVSNC
jgi:hypothetical protein